MNRRCSPMCKRCAAPGRMVCAASARAEAEERHEEEKDAIHDEHRAAMWSRPSEPHSYFDTRDPYAHDVSGQLRDDPAVSRD